MEKKNKFQFQIRVPYAHVDQMGVIYYANYFIYFEMARSELLRESGIPYPEMEKNGILLPVVEAFCKYKKPGHYDELLDIFSRCSLENNLRLFIEYEVKRENNLLASGFTKHVCMSPDGKVLRPTKEILKLTERSETDLS